MTHINDNTKPLLLLGSCESLYTIIEICRQYSINIAGILDSDYYGNTAELSGIPVTGAVSELLDPIRLASLKDKFNFFIATNWLPTNSTAAKRNKEKRRSLIELARASNINCISLVHQLTASNSTNQIGFGVLIDAFAHLGGNNLIGDFALIHSHTLLGHGNIIGTNCVMQHKATIKSDVTLGENVFMGYDSRIGKAGLTFASNTVIAHSTGVRRSTLTAEWISFDGPTKIIYRV